MAVGFDWDTENTKHLAAHKVTPGEFEQAMRNDALDLDCDYVEDEERYRTVGITDNALPADIVPKFATEAEEAEWWYKNRHVHAKIFHATVRAGEARILTKMEPWRLKRLKP